ISRKLLLTIPSKSMLNSSIVPGSIRPLNGALLAGAASGAKVYREHTTIRMSPRISITVTNDADALLNMIQRLAEDKIHGRRSGTGQIILNLNGVAK
ncbi:hypothetical protein KJQ97_09360, partial [Campylobacter sp. 2018MI01]|uniref:hypothetical protein n=1 Tax=Campylobacter sp. 2018MI01 TaxID=2836735 RepID=UPI001BDA988F